jgi:hypothetical protein
MSTEGVVFEEDSPPNRVGNITIVPGAPTGMLKWLVKNNLAKDGKSAEKLLLIIAIVAVVVAIGVYVLFNPTPRPPQTPASPGWPKPISVH